jgi:hypothetical protein
MDKVMHRGLYKAYVGDNLITQCQDCKHNITEIGIIKSAPVHRCDQEFNLDGTHKLLIDQYGIPNWCPFKIVEIAEQVMVK